LATSPRTSRLTFQLGHLGLWNGIPPIDVLKALETDVSEQVDIVE
jgi:hypothetical protein